MAREFSGVADVCPPPTAFPVQQYDARISPGSQGTHQISCHQGGFDARWQFDVASLVVVTSSRSRRQVQRAGPGAACHHQHDEDEKQEGSYADDLEEAMNYAKYRSSHAKPSFCTAAKELAGSYHF
ncbi:MAG: hypothetical protein OXE44_06670 [Nitrospinae bacterium]|nr:hypothetical protein [Nitrospinota bacterium]